MKKQIIKLIDKFNDFKISKPITIIPLTNYIIIKNSLIKFILS